MKIDVIREVALHNTPRVKQLSGMFDVPLREKLDHRWQGELPVEEKPWNIGLIVGPSGCGKSSIARDVFGEEKHFSWQARSVCDDFDSAIPIADIAATCSAVGFNTIPSWLKPYAVLSTGEKFRVDIARRLIESADDDLIVIDEFTSVVDRLVAQTTSHAVQKYIRKREKKLVCVTCHYDVLEWLQPDWVLEPATMTFQWRLLQRRPSLNIEISRCAYAAWQLFAPFHYLTAELARSAACYVLFVEDHAASFGAVLHRPHPRVDNIKGLSRLVTLPDFQGFGLAMILTDALAAAHKAIGNRFHTYPAHPSLVRSFDHSPKWEMRKKPGVFSAVSGAKGRNSRGRPISRGGRPCAVFEYHGEAMEINCARSLIEGATT